MEMPLKGRVAVVTGASRKRGLGRAIAKALAEAGADVVVTARGTVDAAAARPQDELDSGWLGAESVAEELRAAGVRAEAMALDVTDPRAVRSVIDGVVARFGRIDILVNNAAYSRGSDRVPLVDVDVDLWRRVIDVNLNGTMLCCKYAAQAMVRQGQGGSIVSISSGAAAKGDPKFSAYAASKSGVHALTASLAAELGAHDITCNVVAPGFLDTARIDMLRRDGRWEERLSTIPAGRPGAVEEVAQMVCYLCGPHARYISGEVIYLTGGEVRKAAR